MRIGTRRSALSQAQTRAVVESLLQVSPGLQVEHRLIQTQGDREPDRPLAEVSEPGFFTSAIERALLNGEIDLAVHSLKDLPVAPTPGLVIAAIPPRADPRDCLVSRLGVGLAALPQGARVGTSSLRRSAQLLALRPDLRIIHLRGNVDTRLVKARGAEYDAIVLAAAGLIRLGREAEITEYLLFEQMLPAPGQGALAVQVREGDPLRETVAALDSASSRAEVTAERAFLRALGGGCRVPVAAVARVLGAHLVLTGLVALPDGTRVARGELEGEVGRAIEIGASLAARVGGCS